MWPYLYVACAGLPDRGYSLARILGLMVTAWLCWLWASVEIASFSPESIGIAFAIVAAGGAFLSWRRRNRMRQFLTSRWKLLLAEEVVFVVAFAAMAFIRMLNPDLWHAHMGGEKPMDFAYLNAIIRSETFPPYNPWFAGSYINYYYFGFVPFAALIKYTATLPEVGYNLALVALCAVSAMAVFGLTFALVRRRIGKTGLARTGFAALAVLFVLGIGNLRQAQLLGLEAIRGDWRGQPLLLARSVLTGNDLPGEPPRWYFHASRAIRWNEEEVQPITEFPFFTFLYGDLHPHLMGLPLLLAALGLSISLARPRGGSRFSNSLLLALAAWSLGASWAVNTWDVPTCAAVLAGGLLFAELRRGRKLAAAVSATTAKTLLLVALGFALFLPFHHWWSPAQGLFRWWDGPRTAIGDYAAIFGVFLFALPPVIWSAYRRGRAHSAPISESLTKMPRGWSIPAAVAAVLAVSVLVFAGATLAALLLPALVLCLVATFKHENDRFLYGLAALAFGITLIPEVLVLEGDLSRMNTVFKFYFQAWTLFSICAAVAVSRVLATRPRPLYLAGLTTLVLAALLYPLTATPARAGDRFSPDIAPTLNGMSFLQRADYQISGRAFDLNSDLPAIRWLRNNVEGTPVIAEMNTHPTLYSWGNRFSVYTGLPSIVGWNWHLRQQMSVLPVSRIANRIRDLREIFDTTDSEKAWDLLCRYEARYVIVGELERAYADRQGLEKFDADKGRFWDLVFDENGVRIYRVHPQGPALISKRRPSNQ